MRRSPRPRLRESERGLAAPVGVGLLLLIGLLGTVTVVALGGAAIQDIETQAQNQRAEQAITMFDSQTARVALGDSAVQTISLGDSGGGSYRVEPNSGQISIIQADCDDDDVNDDGNVTVTGWSGEDDAYILPPTDLGAVVYENGDTTMAYQGGGVWRQTGDSGGVMVSPPEFHYRGSTLTLPVIKTRGSGGTSGSTEAVVRDTAPDTPPATVFPDSSQSFPDYCVNNGESFENPTLSGRTLVRIQSEYAGAWGRYFEQRTEGVVLYPSSNTVMVELISLDPLGEFAMPGEGGSVTVSGAKGGHSVPEFTTRLRPDDEDSADFNNLQWSLYAEQGDQQFELHLKKSGSDGCADGTTDITADVTIYYSDDNGNTYHGWHADDVYDAQCGDLDGDGDYEIYFDITFVDNDDGDNTYGESHSSDPKLTYETISSSELHHLSPGDSLASPTLDGHSASWEPVSPTSGTTLTTDQLINHYFAELPEGFELTVDDKGSNTISESSSSGMLETTGAGRYVTYLHVTENEIEVELSA